MDLRRLVQGLVAPDPEPAEPYRRSRGTLLVPSAQLEAPPYISGAGLPPHWSGTLSPPPTDSPAWPYERWSIESFSFNWHYEAAIEPTHIEEGWEPLVLLFTLHAGGDNRWSVTVEKEWPNRNEKEKNVDLRGSIYANLASPLSLQGGEQFAIDVAVEIPTTFKLQFGARQYVSVDPFRMPYSVDHGGG